MQKNILISGHEHEGVTVKIVSAKTCMDQLKQSYRNFSIDEAVEFKVKAIGCITKH